MKFALICLALVVGLSVFLLVGILIIYPFALTGLEESERQSPHLFDGHHYLNYHFLHHFMNVFPFILLGAIIFMTILWLLANPDLS